MVREAAQQFVQHNLIQSHLAQPNRQVSERQSALLMGVAEAAKQLLTIPDFDEAVAGALRAIAQAATVDRIYLLENKIDPDTGELFAECPYELTAPGIIQTRKIPGRFPMPLASFDRMTQQLKAGKSVQILACELPSSAQAMQHQDEALSLLVVPVIVEADWWGAIGFDDCTTERIWTEAEIAALETAAACIGGAIKRDRTQKARLLAEQKVLIEREQAARARAVELSKTNEAIGQTLNALTATPDLDEFLGQILLKISQPIKACKANLFLYDEETETLRQHISLREGKAYQSFAPGDPALFQRPIPVSSCSAGWEIIINSSKPFTLDETNPETATLWWPESLAWHQAEGHKAITCACLKVGQKPIGFIGFSFRHLTVLSDEQLEFIQALANQATLSIHLTRLAEEAKQTAVFQEQERAAQERAAQLTRSNQALKSSLDSLAQQPELDSFLQRVVDEATLQTGAVSGDLFLYNEVDKTFSLHVATDNNGDWRSVPDMLLWEQPIPFDEAPAFGEMILQKKSVVIENVQETLKPGPGIWDASIDWHLNRKHTNIICVPLVLGDRVLGFLGLPFVGETTVTQDNVELAQALANQATLAIQLTQLAEDAKQTAILQEQEKAIRQRVAELAKTNEALTQTLDVLTSESELDSFLGKILTQINAKIGVNDTHLFLYNKATHTLRQHIAVQDGCIFKNNAPGDPDIFKSPIPADITKAWEIITESSKPFTIDDNNPDAAEFLWPSTPEWHAARGHQSATCICMKAGDEALGFIGFAFRDQTVLTNEQLEFIQALSNQATLSIQLTRLAEQSQSDALAAALNDERTRLAREIHDTLAQAFTGVSIQLEAVRGIAAKLTNDSTSISSLEDVQTYILRARDLARKGLSEARRSVRALRSEALETDTLPDALRKVLTQTSQDTGLSTQFYLEGLPFPLPDDIQLNLLRIAQEAITNVLRYAQATQIDLTLSFISNSPQPLSQSSHPLQRIQLRVVDDGVGFDTTTRLLASSGFGLIGMRERATRFHGSFDLQSTPGIGTSLEIVIPLNKGTLL